MNKMKRTTDETPRLKFVNLAFGAAMILLLAMLFVPGMRNISGIGKSDNSSTAYAGQKFKIAWSHYTGWEPWEYARHAGIIKKHADKNGIEIELSNPMDYMESINQYTSGQWDGCVMTNMDALMNPAVGGVDSEAIIIGDYSNGNDGVGAKKEKSIAELAGKKIYLVEGSVSQYLLSRGIEKAGKTEKEMKVKLVNSTEGEIVTAYETNQNAIVVTWNPLLMTVKESGTNLLFDSSQIPGEILDLMVVRANAPESLKKALAGAWFETMQVMSGKSKNSKDAIAYMAKFAGNSEPAFRRQLETTAMYYDPKDAAAFAKSKQLKTTMEYVRTFLFDHNFYGTNASSKDSIGIEFPDKSVMGSKRNVKLRFTDKYMQMAADGKL